jgi:hypothetical protein
MKRTMLMLAAGAIALSPSAILAHPGGGGGGGGGGAAATGMGMGPTMRANAGSLSQGSTNGVGWDHQNSGKALGQPGAECGSAQAPTRPGNAENARGSAFNPNGIAGTKYAGEQPQNSRNTAAVSQYDSACLHQPLR